MRWAVLSVAHSPERAGHKVWLIGQTPATATATILNTTGLTLLENGQSRVVAVQAAVDFSATGIADLIIVLVKSVDTRTAIEAAQAVIGSETTVLFLQNGLGHEDILADVVGWKCVLAGKTYVGGVLTAPGFVTTSVQGKLTLIGERDGSLSTRVQRIADAFNAAGLQTSISRDIYSAIWDKLLINVATGALTAITRLSYGELYQSADLKATALAAVNEAVQVAAAHGIRLSVPDAETAWNMASAGLPDSFKTSMLQSIEKGQRTEIDFINGAVVNWGTRKQIATPVNSTLVTLVNGLKKHKSNEKKNTTPALPVKLAVNPRS